MIIKHVHDYSLRKKIIGLLIFCCMLVLLGAISQRNGYIYSIKNKFIFLNNYLSSYFIIPKSFNINIKHLDYQKLRNNLI